MNIKMGIAVAILFSQISLADQLAQSDSSPQAASKGTASATAVKQLTPIEISNLGCQKKLTAEITSAARKKGVVGEIGIQFYENDTYKKAGLTPKKEQMYRYETPPFIVEEGYITNSKADALVVFTKEDCRIIKLVVNTGGFTK